MTLALPLFVLALLVGLLVSLISTVSSAYAEEGLSVEQPSSVAAMADETTEGAPLANAPNTANTANSASNDTANSANATQPTGNDTAGTVNTAASTTPEGWVSNKTGWRYYVDGVPVTGLQTITVTTDEGTEKRTYYFTTKGYREAGWHKLNGQWYFFDSSTKDEETGAQMWTGWLSQGKDWFYLNGKGQMRKGWQKIEEKWYYFRGGDNGRMWVGWLNDGGSWYYLKQNESGQAPMVTGLQRLKWSRGTSWFAFRGGDSGRMLTGWHKLKGEKDTEASWYYFKPGDGNALSGWLYWGGGWFYLDAANNGKMMTGWQRLKWSKGTSWFYFRGGDSGRMVTGWHKLKYGKETEAFWYYFRPGDGNMYSSGWLQLGRAWYYLSSSGKMLSGWQTFGNAVYYLGGSDSGRMRTGWAAYGNTQRFLDNEGLWHGTAFDQKMKTIQNRAGNTLYGSFQYVASFNYRRTYDTPSGHWAPGYAMQMYDNGAGNCYRYAALFCMIALAHGYDAQVVTGSVPSRSGGWAPHGWVEIYHQGTTYICDPDLEHSMPRYGWYWVTYANAPVTYRK
ncbi:MAG: hypothetical protein LBL27_00200 [Coriobacteriales bacterium]|nr:hypothetical protein [Coriobacteriales bacterium]